MRRVSLCLLFVLLWAGTASAQGALPVRRVITVQVLAADTARMEVLKRLTEGRVADAVEYWVLATGKDAPAWLVATRTAYDASKQVAGACQGVAQTIHTAFTRLGGKPEFIQLTTDARYIVFKMQNGKDMRLTNTGYHVVVRMGGRAYDAYTGAAGMPWAEFLSRLGARSDIAQKVTEATVRLP